MDFIGYFIDPSYTVCGHSHKLNTIFQMWSKKFSVERSNCYHSWLTNINTALNSAGTPCQVLGPVARRLVSIFLSINSLLSKEAGPHTVILQLQILPSFVQHFKFFQVWLGHPTKQFRSFWIALLIWVVSADSPSLVPSVDLTNSYSLTVSSIKALNRTCPTAVPGGNLLVTSCCAG